MKKLAIKTGLVNTIGTLGYLILMLGWLLLAVVIMILLVASSVIVIPPDTSQVIVSSAPAATPIVIGSYILTAIMVIVTIGVIVTLPYFIGKWSSRQLRRFMQAIRLVETRRTLFLTKCVVAVVPLFGFLLIQLFLDPGTMTFGTLHIATIVTAVLAIACFGFQLVLARRLRLSSSAMW